METAVAAVVKNPALKWILLISAIVAIILIIIFRKSIGKFFGMNTFPAFTPAEGSLCNGNLGTIKNGVCVLLAEGATCKTVLGATGIITNGVCTVAGAATSEGSPCAMPGYMGGNNGTIQNGACVANNASSADPAGIILKNYGLQVQNTAGAKLYAFTNGQFVVSNSLLQYGKQIISDAYVTSPALYYRSGTAWFLGTDVGITQIL